MELRCSRDLALLLGAVDPDGMLHHRILKLGRQHLLIRDVSTSRPMFWAWQPGTVASTLRSSQ